MSSRQNQRYNQPSLQNPPQWDEVAHILGPGFTPEKARRSFWDAFQLTPDHADWLRNAAAAQLQRARDQHQNANDMRNLLVSEARRRVDGLSQEHRLSLQVTLRRSPISRIIERSGLLPADFTSSKGRLPAINGTLLHYTVHENPNPPASRKERVARWLAGRAGQPVDGYMLDAEGRVVHFSGYASSNHAGDNGRVLDGHTIRVASYDTLPDKLKPLPKDRLALPSNATEDDMTRAIDWGADTTQSLGDVRHREYVAYSALVDGNVGLGYAVPRGQQSRVPDYTLAA